VPSCAEGGVLGVLPGLIAMIQATETVKIATGIGEPLYGRILQYDALRMEFREFRLKRDPGCPLCGKQPTLTKLIDYEGFCGVPAVRPSAPGVSSVTAVEVAARRARGEDFLLLDVRDEDELEKARIEGSLFIPLGELEGRLGELEEWRDRPIVVHCYQGARSARACELLLAKGFKRAEKLTGGIDAWALTVDPDVKCS
jgi:adenylyltransferase/sulfurtransferase